MRIWPALLALVSPAVAAEPLRFERIVIDDNFPGGYQVEVADVNGDKKPDIVALGGSTLAWYENPSWKKRVITDKAQTPGIISSATGDLDGDGLAEIAVAYDFEMNQPGRGKLGLATQSGGSWSFREIEAVPSIHRLRWGDLDKDGRRDLVVAPILGLKAQPPGYDQQFVTLRVYRGFDPKAARPAFEPIGMYRILHAIDVVDLFRDGRSWVVTAAAEGTRLTGWGKQFVAEPKDRWLNFRIFTVWDQGQPPAKAGASEVHVGRLADGRCLLATIEPWHGNRVSVYTAAYQSLPEIGPYLDQFGPRTVIDDTLDEGHALWVADVDGDGSDEVFAGHRGKDARVSAYKFDGKTWARTVLDPNLTAQDLRGGDLDGDGTPDVVAIGGKSHNVVWFRPVRAKAP